uniref:Uncharacterized protein n=1 Tax=Pelagomonas calceolata TaxID=35677 RepID=A0A7S4EA17_9STRA
MNSFTRCRPITSSLEKPVRFDALRFHTLTRPFESMPKIGAFAVSMRRAYSCSWAILAVMSWPMPTTPTTCFCSSLRVVALSSTCTRVPGFADDAPAVVAARRRVQQNLQHDAALGDERELEVRRLLAR